MTSSNAHSKAPSLLADTQDSNPLDIRSINPADQPSSHSAKTLFIWLSIILLTLATGSAWVLDSPPQTTESTAQTPAARNAIVPPATTGISPPTAGQPPMQPISEPAQIFSEAPEQHANLNDTLATSVPTPEKLEKAVPTQPVQRTTATSPTSKTIAAPRASDIDVLVALMHYIESPDTALPTPTRKTLQDRINACPAANTEAGIHCRERICADLPGSASLCTSP
ncbi:hypothetical protein [Pseudomonas sp.]|uniref:hypothetical protein n=1 Tax=Pseudomonas sp. TaxID=306 RepID=UPI0026396F34|nr:hypothetical protein [Pseudomonas sp.]